MIGTPVIGTPGIARRRLAGTRGLAVNGGALMINVLASAVTGLVFWVVVARTSSPDVVANASTTITAIIAVVSLTQQAFVFTLPSLLAVSPEPKRLARNTYAMALAATVLVAPLYVLAAPSLAGGLSFLRAPHIAALFIAGCLVWCLFSLQDAVLTGVRKAGVVLFENTTWGVARLLIVAAGGVLGVRLGVGWLALSWIAPALVLVVAVSWYLFRSESSPLAAPLGVQQIAGRRLVSYLGAEYLASVLSSCVTLIGGAYALTTFGAAAAAPFVTAASLVIVVEGALASFAQALAVEACKGDRDRARAGNLLRLSALLLGGISLGAVVVSIVFGEQVMGLLGEEYRAVGGTALAILMLCVPARSVAVVSNADNRIRGEGGRNLLQQILACVVIFGLLLSGVADSVVGLCWAVVAMRVAPAVMAVFHLRAGRLLGAPQ